MSDFYMYFKENMEDLGLPAPASLFGSVQAAVANATVILSQIDKMGKFVTIGDLIGAGTRLEGPPRYIDDQCQRPVGAFALVHDYSQYLGTIRQLKLGATAMDQAFCRIVFNVMATNCDDHTKNFSFMLRQNGSWELAPAYDLIYAYNPNGEWTYQHMLSVNGKFKGILRDDLLLLADRFEVNRPDAVISKVGAAVKAWPSFAVKAGVSDKAISRIASNHVQM